MSNTSKFSSFPTLNFQTNNNNYLNFSSIPKTANFKTLGGANKEFYGITLKPESKIDLFNKADNLFFKVNAINEKISSLRDKTHNLYENISNKKKNNFNLKIFEKNFNTTKSEKKIINVFTLKKKIMLSFVENDEEQLEIDENTLYEKIKSDKFKKEQRKNLFRNKENTIFIKNSSLKSSEALGKIQFKKISFEKPQENNYNTINNKNILQNTFRKDFEEFTPVKININNNYCNYSNSGFKPKTSCNKIKIKHFTQDYIDAGYKKENYGFSTTIFNKKLDFNNSNNFNKTENLFFNKKKTNKFLEFNKIHERNPEKVNNLPELYIKSRNNSKKNQTNSESNTKNGKFSSDLVKKEKNSSFDFRNTYKKFTLNLNKIKFENINDQINKFQVNTDEEDIGGNNNIFKFDNLKFQKEEKKPIIKFNTLNHKEFSDSIKRKLSNPKKIKIDKIEIFKKEYNNLLKNKKNVLSILIKGSEIINELVKSEMVKEKNK